MLIYFGTITINKNRTTDVLKVNIVSIVRLVTKLKAGTNLRLLPIPNFAKLELNPKLVLTLKCKKTSTNFKACNNFKAGNNLKECTDFKAGTKLKADTNF